MGEVEKIDGRRDRWRDHRVARRAELLDGTLAAIRLYGADIGLEAVAHANGISKTVLYKNFTDKEDLIAATMARYVETTLSPHLYRAMSDDLDEYQLTRAVIAAYVETLASDREIYLYVMTNRAVGAGSDIVAESEQLIAELLTTVIEDRFLGLHIRADGAAPIAFAVVGAVRSAARWWMSDMTMSADALVDYLTMIVWGGIQGVAEIGGRPETFNSLPHRIDE